MRQRRADAVFADVRAAKRRRGNASDVSRRTLLPPQKTRIIARQQCRTDLIQLPQFLKNTQPLTHIPNIRLIMHQLLHFLRVVVFFAFLKLSPISNHVVNQCTVSYVPMLASQDNDVVTISGYFYVFYYCTRLFFPLLHDT